MNRLLVIVLAVLGIAGSCPAYAALTGVIQGKVVTPDGLAVPGAHVVVSGGNLPGNREEWTNENGEFRIPELPPGTYTVTADMEGLVPARQDNVKVSLNATTRVTLTLSMDVALQITVTGAAPVVDVSSATQTVNIDRSFTEKLPGQSSYQDGMAMAGGTVGGGNPQVHGATKVDNLYLLDGVDTTDTVTGTFASNVNPDAIEQVEVQTGGFSAEYGRVQGGVVNAVTKSGGNSFSGSLRLEYTDNTWTSDSYYSDTEPEKAVTRIPTATLGGPIVKDMLWFFTSVQYVANEDSLKVIGDPNADPADPNDYSKTVSTDDIGMYPYAKLTFRPFDDLTLTGSWNAEDRQIHGTNASTARLPSATSKWEQGGPFYGFNASYILGRNSLLTLNASANNGTLNTSVPEHDTSGAAYADSETGVHWGALEAISKEDRWRRNISLTYSHFLDNWFYGSHDIKSGLDYQRLLYKETDAIPGDGYYFYNMDKADTPFKNDRSYAAGFYDRWQRPARSQAVEDTGNYYAMFVQDAWEVADDITVNIGLRGEAVSFRNDTGRVKIESNSFKMSYDSSAGDMFMVAPRLGFIWDIGGEASQKFSMFAGRYYSPLTLQIPSMLNEAPPTTETWYRQLIPGQDRQDYNNRQYEGDWFRYDDSWAENTNTLDPNLKSEQTDEVQVTYEREIFPMVSLGATLTRRQTRNIVEDAGVWYQEDANGNITGKFWAWNVPENYADDPDHSYYLDHYRITNPPGAKRDYTGLEISAQAQAGNLDLLLSYSIARVEGTTFADQPDASGGTYSSTGTMTRFSVYYDTPELSRNLYGKLPYDIDKYFKLNAAYDFFPDKLYAFTLGASYIARNGYAYTRMTKDPTYGGFYSTEEYGRGTERLPPVSWLDLSVQKHFPISDRWGSFSIILDISNVFNSEQLTTRQAEDNPDQGWKISTNGGHVGPRSYNLSVKYAF